MASAPCLLYSVHFRFRYWWFLNFKRNWRVVEENADLTILIFFVAECVFDLRLASIGSTREVVVAHGNGNISVQVNLMVVKDDIGPAFATIDCKASILGNSVTNCLWPYEVRHGLACHRAKLDILGFGWLEEHVAVAIAIKFTCCFACCCNIVSALKIGLGDSFDGICPCLLCGANLLLWDRPVHGKSQVGSKCVSGLECRKCFEERWVYDTAQEMPSISMDGSLISLYSWAILQLTVDGIWWFDKLTLRQTGAFRSY